MGPVPPAGKTGSIASEQVGAKVGRFGKQQEHNRKANKMIQLVGKFFRGFLCTWPLFPRLSESSFPPFHLCAHPASTGIYSSLSARGAQHLPPQVLSHRALDRHLLPGWSLCPGPGLLLLLTREDTETWGERTAIRQPAAVEESPDPEPVFVTLCYTATLMYSSFLSLNHEVSFLNECDSLLI